MHDFTYEELTISVKHVDKSMTMTWLGQSAAKDPGRTLTPYLNRFIEEVRGQELTIHYRQL